MLEQLIAQHRAAIAERWFERVTASYPDQTTRFLREQKDPFANPMGAAMRRGMRQVIDGLAEGTLAEARQAETVAEATSQEGGLGEGLDSIVRIRALQDMQPSEAVSFVLDLKRVLRDELIGRSDSCSDADTTPRLELAIERVIDELLLLAFDVFVARREQVFEIRVNEIRNRSMKTLGRLNEWRARRDETPCLDAVD
jgi:hypothetical protein